MSQNLSQVEGRPDAKLLAQFTLPPEVQVVAGADHRGGLAEVAVVARVDLAAGVLHAPQGKTDEVAVHEGCGVEVDAVCKPKGGFFGFESEVQESEVLIGKRSGGLARELTPQSAQVAPEHVARGKAGLDGSVEGGQRQPDPRVDVGGGVHEQGRGVAALGIQKILCLRTEGTPKTSS